MRERETQMRERETQMREREMQKRVRKKDSAHLVHHFVGCFAVQSACQHLPAHDRDRGQLRHALYSIA